MRNLAVFMLSLGVWGFVACSADLEADSQNTTATGTGAVPNGTSATGATGGGNTGAGGEGLTAFNYTEYCGEGCLPEDTKPAVDDPCVAGSGGAGGGGTGGSGDVDCKLGIDEVTQATAGMCTVPGTQTNGGPCISSADCAPDHGCVDEGGNGVCRQYCCGSLEDCPDQVTFCDLRPMVDARQSIPVCAPVDDCILLDSTTCDADETCTIVRQDGTTSCVTPGPGMHGDPCPCAADHVCATGLNQCLKLCRTDVPETCIPEAPKCQGGATIYPPGFGVCVEN